MTAPDLPAMLARCESATPVTDDEALALVRPFGSDARHHLYEALTRNSIDAAVAFHEAVLPGWSIQIIINADGEKRVRLLPTESGFVDMLESPDIDVSHKDVPLAIICADLEALIAKGESDAL